MNLMPSSPFGQNKQLMKKHLKGIRDSFLVALSKMLYPVFYNYDDPQSSLFQTLKIFCRTKRESGLHLKQIIQTIVNHAFVIDHSLGYSIRNLLNDQYFLKKFQNSPTQLNKTKQDSINAKLYLPRVTQYIDNSPEKIQIDVKKKTIQQSTQDHIQVSLAKNGQIQQKRAINQILESNQNQKKSLQQDQKVQQKLQILKQRQKSFDKNKQLIKPQAKQYFIDLTQTSHEKIIVPHIIQQKQQKIVRNSEKSQTIFNHIGINIIKNSINEQNIKQKNGGIINQTCKSIGTTTQPVLLFSMSSVNNPCSISGVKSPSSRMQQQKPKRGLYPYVQDMLSSARPACQSGTNNFTYSIKRPQHKSQKTPQKLSQKLSFFPPKGQKIINNTSNISKYYLDQNLIRNLADKNMCLCEMLCENIVRSDDSFYCQHCRNIYHTRCMKRNHQSKNCAICHLRLLMPNKPVQNQIFVGLLRKLKRRHQILFELPQDLVSYLKSKKQGSLQLQVRSFRLLKSCLNIILFPDSCSITLNSKQVRELKPLHKQSSLKHRRDQAIPIKHFQQQNKLIITQNSLTYSTNDRIEHEDHLIGIYLIQEEGINQTVNRIIRGCVNDFTHSKLLLSKNFILDGMQGEIDCEIIQLPLTCALTTDKLKYPARGIFCKHFQCFDLRNYVMMISSSLNPRWICPICKASCYEFNVDCILAEILNQYIECHKVQQIKLYKDGRYQILDKEGDPIDPKGKKIKAEQLNSKMKCIDDLKIEDKNKRERQRQTKLQQPQKRKKVEIPGDAQIVSLLSDSD